MKSNSLRRSTVLSLALTSAVVACARVASAPADVGDRLIVLAAGESATIAGATVRLVAVQDSRCPSDVVCITAGDVVMMFAFSGAGDARTDTLRLMSPPKSSTYGGLLFQPTTVAPYPGTRAAATTKTVTLRVNAAP
jgi:hypothetical protein